MGRICDRSLALIVVAILASVCLVPAIALDPEPDRLDGTVLDSDSYGNIRLSLSTEDFMKGGYAYGDVVRMTAGHYAFNALLTDVFIGYAAYEVGIKASEGDQNVVMFAYSMNLASLAHDLKYGDRVTVNYDHHSDPCPHIKSGYLREPLPSQSDSDFANFRSVDLGDFRMWRSTSPLYLSTGTLKPKVCDGFFGSEKISFVINIADDPAQLSAKIEAQRGSHLCDNYVRLYDGGRIFSKFCEGDVITYAHLFREPFLQIIEHQGESICLHCSHGKDRTGFVFMLLECIAGWSLEDIATDYTDSFANIYGIEKGSQEYKDVRKNFFDRIYYVMAHPFDDLIDAFFVDWSKVDISAIDPHESAKSFLLNKIGLTQEEFLQLELLVTK